RSRAETGAGRGAALGAGLPADVVGFRPGVRRRAWAMVHHHRRRSPAGHLAPGRQPPDRLLRATCARSPSGVSGGTNAGFGTSKWQRQTPHRLARARAAGSVVEVPATDGRGPTKAPFSVTGSGYTRCRTRSVR